MEREVRGCRIGLAALALGALLALPGAAADVAQAPVRGDADAEYQADAGALLAHLAATDPTVRFELAFERATLYELALAPPSLLQQQAAGQAPGVPTILAAEQVPRGALRLDARRDAAVLVFTDLAGLGFGQLPVEPPAEPARFVVESAAPLAGGLGDGASLDPRSLELGAGLAYAVDGVAVDDPVRATAHGDLLLLAVRGLWVAEGTGKAYEPGATPAGHRLLLVRAEGATATLEGSDLAAVLRLPATRLGVGGGVDSEVGGQQVGAEPAAGLAAEDGGVAVRSGATLAARLGGASQAQRSAAPGAGAADAGAMTFLDPSTAAAGALLGGAVALAAAAFAGLLAGGKYGLFALLAPLYARLQQDEVLANGTREAIYKHVVEHPGVNVSEVVKHFGLGWGATVYHLRVLERSHLVTSSKHGRQVCYFQNGGRYHGQMAGISVLRNPNAARVAATILARPGIAQRDVCRLTSLAQPTVSWHLQRLEEAGLLEAQGAPRKRYRALPPLLALAERGFLHAPPAPTVAAAPAAAPVVAATTDPAQA